MRMKKKKHFETHSNPLDRTNEKGETNDISLCARKPICHVSIIALFMIGIAFSWAARLLHRQIHEKIYRQNGKTEKTIEKEKEKKKRWIIHRRYVHFENR